MVKLFLQSCTVKQYGKALLQSSGGRDYSIAKLSQAPAPAGLSLALFPNYPATRPDPTGKVNFWAIDHFFGLYGTRDATTMADHAF